MLLELTGQRISSTEIILSNNIFPLPNKSDNTGENVRKASGYLDDIKKALVTNIDTVFN